MSDLGSAGQANATVDAVVENKEPLGLTWGLRPATITSTDPPEAILDGDSVPIGVIPMIGPMAVGQRVYVMFVPPAGNYVSGLVNTPLPGTLVGWTAATGNGAFLSAETSILATGTIVFQVGGAYEIDFEVDTEGSAAGNFANFQIRRTSVAGAVLRANSGHPMSSVAGFGSTCKGSAIVTNTTSADISDIAVLTLSSPLAGNVRVVGGANRLAFLRATYIGPAAKFSSATAL